MHICQTCDGLVAEPSIKTDLKRCECKPLIADITNDKLRELDSLVMRTGGDHEHETWTRIRSEYLELKAKANTALCVYCGHVGPKQATAMMLHVTQCEKNPAVQFKKLMESFNVEKMLADVKAAEKVQTEYDKLVELLIPYCAGLAHVETPSDCLRRLLEELKGSRSTISGITHRLSIKRFPTSNTDELFAAINKLCNIATEFESSNTINVCARCHQKKNTPVRRDPDGYICAGCLEKECDAAEEWLTTVLDVLEKPVSYHLGPEQMKQARQAASGSIEPIS